MNVVSVGISWPNDNATLLSLAICVVFPSSVASPRAGVERVAAPALYVNSSVLE